MKKQVFLLLILFLLSLSGSAQFINFGQDRAALRWKQIKTDQFQIIYPDFFEKNAQRMANIYQQLYTHSHTSGIHPRKIAMVVHADGGVSNGNVALVPRKSELYVLPPQNPIDTWLEHLCTHEFRHVMQLDKVNQGTTKGLSYIFGELFPIAIVGLYIPMWFMEGDAVAYETSVGRIGRGRSPEFLNEMKAQILEKGIYNYSKAVLGSYKDFVPNRYTMGYFMTANARINYGPDIWTKALTRTGNRPFGITPFAKSLKQTMQGQRDSLWQDSAFRSLFLHPEKVKASNTYPDAKRTLYRDNFSELQKIWKQETDTQNSLFDTIPTRNKYYTNYYYPTPADSNNVIAYKQGLQETGAFVQLQNGKEKRLTRTGLPDDYKFAVQNNQIVWSEYYPHLRWEQGGRIRLSSYHLKKRQYIRYKGRHNQLAPFPVDGRWGFVEINRQNEAAIVITDSSLRRELWRLTAQTDELFIHPSYANGKIFTIVQSSQGLRIEEIDILTRQRRPLTSSVYYELDNPILRDSVLYYRASYNGNNAFYQHHPQTPFFLLGSPYGVRFPAIEPHNNTLYFSFYTADGYKPGCTPLSNLSLQTSELKSFPLAEAISTQENWHLTSENDSVFISRKYSKPAHLVNIHSWGPLFIDLYEMKVDLGAVIYSQNKLSTLSFTAGYVRQSGYVHGTGIFNATYSGWWPIFEVNLQTGRDNFNHTLNSYNYQTDSTEILYLCNKALRSSADVTVRLPFNLSVKQYKRTLQPYFRYKTESLHRIRPQQIYRVHQEGAINWLYPTNKEFYKIQTSPRAYHLVEYGISFNNQTRMTEQEINPRWGQRLSAGYTQSLKKSINLGNQWWSEVSLYFPGLFTNHSLSLYGGFQHMSAHIRNYGSKILYPRGTDLYGYEMSTFRSGYKFPLLFPDWSISSLIYLKSIEVGLFYDWGSAKNNIKQSTYSSYGMELTTDTHFFRLTYPIHLGIRTGYENQNKKLFAELLFSIGLSI